MSSLRDSYVALTFTSSNTKVTEVEENIILRGNTYEAGIIENVFGAAAELFLSVEAGPELILALSRSTAVTTSELFQVDTFINPDVAGGTPLFARNQHYGSSNSPTFTINLNPTVNALGDNVYTSIVRGVAGQGNQDGLSEIDNSWVSILDPGIKILYRVTNLGSAGVADFYFRLSEIPVDLNV